MRVETRIVRCTKFMNKGSEFLVLEKFKSILDHDPRALMTDCDPPCHMGLPPVGAAYLVGCSPSQP